MINRGNHSGSSPFFFVSSYILIFQSALSRHAMEHANRPNRWATMISSLQFSDVLPPLCLHEIVIAIRSSAHVRGTRSGNNWPTGTRPVHARIRSKVCRLTGRENNWLVGSVGKRMPRRPLVSRSIGRWFTLSLTPRLRGCDTFTERCFDRVFGLCLSAVSGPI